MSTAPDYHFTTAGLVLKSLKSCIHYDATTTLGQVPALKQAALSELRKTTAAFDSAVTTIHGLKNLDFVVVTGDFGLEMVSPYREDASAQAVADKLLTLPVEDVLLVPGNNDLLNEDYRDRIRYDRFVKALGSKTTSKKIIDLTTGDFVRDRVRFIGLESSTFKNSGCEPGSATSTSSASHEAYVYQQNEMQRAATALRHDQPTIIFTHIPDLDDPFQPDPRKPKKPSWRLESKARNIWDHQIVCKSNLKRIFAGHFHSNKATDYGDFDKWWISRPLAPEFQSSSPVQGFSIGKVVAGEAQGLHQPI